MIFKRVFFLLILLVPVLGTSARATVAAPPCMQLIAEQIPCTGLDASVFVDASAGLPPYQYSKDGVTFQASPRFDNLPYGTLTFTVKDANACQSTTTVTTIRYNVKKPIIAGLMVNEVGKGTADGNFIELIVLGQPGGRTDISGWIVDDNNGTFGTAGTSAGHLRFNTDPIWKSIKVGTVIVIGDMVTTTIDSANYQYIISSESTYLNKCGNSPTTTNATYVAGCTAFAGLGYALIAIGSADAVQVRRPNRTYFHGLSFSTTPPVLANGGPDQIAKQVLADFSLYFDANDFRSNGNFYAALRTEATLGKPNPDVNVPYTNSAFIDSLRQPFLEDIDLALPPDFDLCDRSKTILDAGFPGCTYLWSTGATTRSIAVASGGIYSLKMTTPAGCQPTKSVKISLKPTPIASITSDSLLCVGGTLVLNGSSNIPTSTAKWKGPNAFTSTSFTPSISGLTVANSGIYELVASEGICTDTARFLVKVIPVPNIGTAKNGVACVSTSSFDLNTLLTGTTINAGRWTSNPLANPNLNVNVFDIASAGKGNVNFDFTIDIPACLTAVVSAELKVVEPIVAVTGITNCAPDRADYTVDYTFKGGDSLSYFSPEALGISSANGGNYLLNSVSFSSGNTATITVSDLSDCPANSFTINRDCSCISNPGTMDQAVINLPCGTEDVSAIFNNDALVDSPYGDKLRFVLHEGNGSAIVNPKIYSNTPTFNFNSAPLDYFKTYYISSFIEPGDFSGAATINSSCRVSSIGTPVIFTKQPTADFGPSGTFCENDPNARIEYILTGTPPFRFVYLENGILNDTIVNTYGFTSYVTSTSSSKIFSLKDANCNGSFTSVEAKVTVKRLPNANAGLDREICGLSTTMSATPSFGDGLWTESTASPRFANPSNQATAVGVPQAGSYTFTWTESNAPCPSSSDDVVLKFYDNPTANAGNDTSICGREIQLNALPSIGLGLWSSSKNIPGLEIINPDKPNPIIKAPSAGEYFLSWSETAAFCSSLDSVKVRFIDSLSSIISAPKCNNTASGFTIDISILGGIPGSYVVNDKPIAGNKFTTDYIPNGSQYSFLISDSSACGTVVVSGNYTCPCITRAPLLTNTDVLTICEGESFFLTLDNSTVLDANDTLIYVLHDRNDGQLGNIFQFSGYNNFTKPLNVAYGKTYYAAIVVGNKSSFGFPISTGDPCFLVTSGRPVIFQKNLQFTWPASIRFCLNEPQYIPLNVNGQGDFTLTYIENGVEKVKLLTGGNDSILISQGVGIKNYFIKSLVNNVGKSCLNIVSGSIQVTVNTLPTTKPSFKSKLCVGERTTFITQASQFKAFEWDFGNGVYSNSPVTSNRYLQGGKYTLSLKLEDLNGCKNTIQFIDTVDVQELPNVLIASNTFDSLGILNLCLPDTLKLNSVGTNPFYAANNWFINDTLLAKDTSTVSLYLDKRTNFSLRLQEISNYGCIGEQVIQINGVKPEAELIINRREVCNLDDLVGTLRNLVDVKDFKYFYSNALLRDSSNLNPTDFKYRVVNSFGDDSIHVEVKLISKEGCIANLIKTIPVIHVLSDFKINTLTSDTVERCYLEFAHDTMDVNAYNALQYQWSFGNDTYFTGYLPPVQYYKNPGEYLIKLQVLDSTLNCKAEKSKLLIVHALPNLQVYPPGAILCENIPIDFTATGGVYYKWERPDDFTYVDSTIRANAHLDTNLSGLEYKFDVTAYDEHGCTTNKKYTVNYVDLKRQVIQPKDTTIIIGDTVFVDLSTDERYLYTWAPNRNLACDSCSNQAFYPLNSEIYTLQVADIYGCFEDSYQYKITVDVLYKLDMPDAFTPNGDGINDEIYPDGLGVSEVLSYEVFNTTGALLYRTSGKLGSGIAWNGKYQGKLQAAGNYVYMVHAKKAGTNQEITQTGLFKLIR